jgi:hypothetical protein
LYQPFVPTICTNHLYQPFVPTICTNHGLRHTLTYIHTIPYETASYACHIVSTCGTRHHIGVGILTCLSYAYRMLIVRLLYAYRMLIVCLYGPSSPRTCVYECVCRVAPMRMYVCMC